MIEMEGEISRPDNFEKQSPSRKKRLSINGPQNAQTDCNLKDRNIVDMFRGQISKLN